MLCGMGVGPTDRIPGFAICACCGSRRELASCHDCGLLACGDCRDERACAACQRERREAATRLRRRARIAELGRQTALVALVGMSGLAGVGAATLPGSYLTVAPAHQLKLDQPRKLPPIPAMTAWGQPIVLHCYACGEGIACFAIDGD